jgi:hypothetical protein
MNVDRAIAIIESVLAPKSLNLVQIEIVRGVVAGYSYQQIIKTIEVDTQIAKMSGSGGAVADRAVIGSGSIDKSNGKQTGQYKISYIRETSAQLWQMLTLRLGQKVTQKSLAAVLLWHEQQTEFKLVENNLQVSDDLESIEIDWDYGIQPPGATLGSEYRFYGRTEELEILTNWCLTERCRLVLLVGMGGMGKTTLAWEAAHLFDRVASPLEHCQFDRVIWRSLVNSPSITTLCTDLLELLNPQLTPDLTDSVEAQIDLLIACFNRYRCLLILDNVESILEGQLQCGQYLPGYDGYDRLFKAIGELPHQSCAILTSREKPHTIARSQIVNPQLIRSMTIDGMTANAAHQLVQAYGCPQLPEQIWQEVHTHYGGNPLALKIATITAVEMTGGGENMMALYPLMKQGKLQFRHIDDILERQFDRLSDLEQQLVYWLAIERQPVTGTQLRSNLVLNPQAPGSIINALQSLSRRCITVCKDRQWSIQPVMIAYITRRSIDRFVCELSPDSPPLDPHNLFSHLNTYAIIKSHPPDCSPPSQSKSTLYSLANRLLSVWGNHYDLSQHLRRISIGWQSLNPAPVGYLVENILNLLMELDPDI